MEPQEFLSELNIQLTYLFSFARSINELDFAGALMQEMRGVQGGGWSTTITAYQVFEELQTLGRRGAALPRHELRQTLSLYAQLAEAGGVYEGLANMMGVVQLKPYSMWPFGDLVRVRQEPHRVMGPNANATFRNLSQTAIAIGMPRLGLLLENAFRDDIRNGICHADYILANNGLRLRRRNGGIPFTVSFADVTKALQTGLFFFELFTNAQMQGRELYRPAKRVVGHFSADHPFEFTIELQENGVFGLSTSSGGPIRDAAYDRQQAINNRLGGRVFAAYVATFDDATDRLLEEIRQLGFEVLVVVLATDAALAAQMQEIEAGGLWDARVAVRDDGLLLATPYGFRRVTDLDGFRAILPPVDEVQIV